MSQSLPGVLKEQWVSGDDHSYPGDVYHPNFQHSHPAYFEISVHTTTQASRIPSSPSCAGVVAAAGELAKHERHWDIVEDTGCDFIPLVVETYGVWSQFAFHILYFNADHTTARSGISI